MAGADVLAPARAILGLVGVCGPPARGGAPRPAACSWRFDVGRSGCRSQALTVAGGQRQPVPFCPALARTLGRMTQAVNIMFIAGPEIRS